MSSKEADGFRKILDVTSQIEKDYHVDSTANAPTEDTTPVTSISPKSVNKLHRSNSVRKKSQTSEREEHRSPWPSEYDTPTSNTTGHSGSADIDPSNSISYGVGGEYGSRDDFRTLSISTHHNGYPNGNDGLPDGLTPVSVVSSGRMPEQSPGSLIHKEDAAAELLALRYLPAQSGRPTALFENPPPAEEAMVFAMDVIAPSGLHETPMIESRMFEDQDGIFLPGSAYQELHSTLRDHLIFTARSTAPTRTATPEHVDPGLRPLRPGVDHRPDSDPDLVKTTKSAHVTPEREFFLWRTWIDEIAPWVGSRPKVWHGHF